MSGAPVIAADRRHPSIVLVGDAVSGFIFYGPFSSGADAVEWATENASGLQWLVAPLELRESPSRDREKGEVSNG